MNRIIRRGLLASAIGAVALSAAACGSQGTGTDPTGTTSGAWSKGNESPGPAKGIHRILPPPFAITDCNLGEYVGILSAFNAAEIDASHLALSVSTNLDVRALAQQMLTDHQSLATQLASWMDGNGVTSVESEISVDIKLASEALLTALRGDPNFDHDFVVGQMSANWMLTGFFDTVAFMQDFSSSTNGNPGGVTAADEGNGDGHGKLHDSERQFIAIIGMATQSVQNHLGLAFQVESELVGACGVAPAVVGPPDAGTSDAGSSCDGGHTR